MEHKGIEYRALRTTEPKQWKWVIQLNGKQRTGIASSRDSAIVNAKRAIEKAAKIVRLPKPPMTQRPPRTNQRPPA